MCPADFLARAGLLLCLVVGSRQLSITELEVPAQLESGADAVLQCRYDSGGEPEEALIIKWWWTPDSDAEKAQLYQRIAREPGTPIPHNIKVKDNDTIVVPETTPFNSGTYECEVSLMSDKTEEVRRHQKLSVFTPGSGLNLTISRVPDGPDADDQEDVLIECRADDVAPAPDVSLTVNGAEFNMTEYVTGPDSDGLYDIFGNLTLSNAEVEGYVVRCELFFVDKTVTHPAYFVEETYDPSGALNSTELPEDATEPTARVAPHPADSLQTQSGDSIQSHVSFALLFALGLLTQLPALL